MLSNAYLVAKFRFHTAENKPAKNFKILLIINNYFPNFVDPNPKPEDFAALNAQAAPTGAGLAALHGSGPAAMDLGGAPARLRAGPVARAPVGDTTADLQNFGKMLLVFGCIGTDFCN